MKCLLLVIAVVLAVGVNNVSGSWWRRVKEGARNYWRDNKKELIRTGLGILLKGRDLEIMDLDGNGLLDRSELSQHMDERDVDEIMSDLGKSEITQEEMKRYVQDFIISESEEN